MTWNDQHLRYASARSENAVAPSIERAGGGTNIHTAGSPDWIEYDIGMWELHHPSGFKAYIEDDLDEYHWSVENIQGDIVDDGVVNSDGPDDQFDTAQQVAEAALAGATPGPGTDYGRMSSRTAATVEWTRSGFGPQEAKFHLTNGQYLKGEIELSDDDPDYPWKMFDQNGSLLGSGSATSYDDAVSAMEKIWQSTGMAVTSTRKKVAGFQDSNWRTYAPGSGPYTDYGDVVADYEDALDPGNSPKAGVVDNRGNMTAEVYDGSGDLVESKEFYDVGDTKAWATRILQKVYRGEAKGEPGQGKFFTTPGKGKLFSNRTASRKTAFSLWDSVTEPRHKVAGWDWNDTLAGYVAEGASAHFACSCGRDIEAPGYSTCHCGKIWNALSINASGRTQIVCREVPNRGADVVLASRGNRH